MASLCTDELDVCTDFDQLTASEEPTLPLGWSVADGTGAVSVTSEHAFSGNNSVKIVSTGSGYNRGFLTLDLSEAEPLQQEMYGRMMIYLTEDNANAGDFTFLQAEGSNPRAASGAPAGTTSMYRVRLDQRHDHLFTNYDTWIDEDADGATDWLTDCFQQPEFTETTPPDSAYILPKGEWACVRWHMEAGTNHINVHLNENELLGLRVHDTGDACLGDVQQGVWYGPEQFERLHVGVEQYSADALPRTLYIDDIAVDTMPVDCVGNPVPSSTEPSQE